MKEERESWERDRDSEGRERKEKEEKRWLWVSAEMALAGPTTPWVSLDFILLIWPGSHRICLLLLYFLWSQLIPFGDYIVDFQ
jgi:hypothetical protein